MQRIAYYISGHGYGHAVRSIEVMRALTHHNPYYFFHIKTSAPAWLFPLNMESNYALHIDEVDVGTVQHSFYEVDKIETLAKLRKFFSDRSAFVKRELAFLQRYQIQMVVGDIPPLAFEAAYQAGIPSVAIGNFSWDWIYDSYIDEIPEFADIVPLVQEAYQKADVLLRLPFHGPTPAFRAVVDIGLVARRARRTASGVRRMLGLEEDRRPVILIALRPADLERIDFNRLTRSLPGQFIVLGQKRYADRALNLPQDLLPFPELVNAADVVVSKPGYGIVSECIANRTPLVYTERRDFPEYEVLVEGLSQYGVSAYLTPEAFVNGDWAEAISSVVDREWDRPELPATGAAEICHYIEALRSRIVADAG